MKTLLLPSLNSSPISTSLEMRLLSYFARQTIDQATLERIAPLLEQEINWIALVQMANIHGLIPQVYQNFLVVCPNLIPEELLSTLKVRFHLNTLRNQYLIKELIRVLELLESHGISAVPFKGPTLAVLAYGSLSLRQFNDLDIWVHEHDFFKARTILLSDCYQCGLTLHYIGDAESQELGFMRRWGEYPLRHKNGKIMVDLHGRLVAGEFPILSAKFDVFWENLVPVSLVGTQVATLSPEDLLLYLCVHGTKDLWERLNWVCDISGLVSGHPQMNWSQVIEEAKRLEIEQVLYFGLSLARDILALTLPQAVARHVDDKFTKEELSVQIQNRILSGIRPQDIEYSHCQRFYFYSQLLENRRDQCLYYLRFSSRWLFSWLRPNIHDQAFISLPRQCYALYYFIRPIRLLVQFADNTFQRLSKAKSNE
ncbi:MAG: nucleotidyltransferase family protein [Phormidesmis sp. RL_2_1]|nr:nucleotidyltransferase family protein [Phormidesmis sp. RL_2_1]